MYKFKSKLDFLMVLLVTSTDSDKHIISLLRNPYIANP